MVCLSNLALMKGTLIQILKSASIFVYIKIMYRRYGFTIPFSEIFTPEICKMFVYKHTETIEYVKN